MKTCKCEHWQTCEVCHPDLQPVKANVVDDFRPGTVHWVGDPPPPSAQREEPEDHPLYEILMGAINQAMFGKGERHGGARTPFLEQPWVHYAKMHGRGFLTGQAAKKLEEAASTREGLAFEQEVFGAIVYLGMAVLREREEATK